MAHTDIDAIRKHKRAEIDKSTLRHIHDPVLLSQDRNYTCIFSSSFLDCFPHAICLLTFVLLLIHQHVLFSVMALMSLRNMAVLVLSCGFHSSDLVLRS